MQRNLTEQPLVLFADDKAEKQIDPASTFYEVSLTNGYLTIKYVKINPFAEEKVLTKNLVDKNGLIDELTKLNSIAKITAAKRAELTELLQYNHQALIPISACARAVVNAFKEFYDLNKAIEAIIFETASMCISGITKSNGELAGKIHNTVAEHFIVYLGRYLLATAKPTSRNLADILDFSANRTSGSAEISSHLEAAPATTNDHPVTSDILATETSTTNKAPATRVLGTTIPSVPATPIRAAMHRIRTDSQTSTTTATMAMGITLSPTTNAETKVSAPPKAPTTPGITTFRSAPATSNIATGPIHNIENKPDALANALERILIPAMITASKTTCEEAIWNIDCINDLDPKMEIKKSTRGMMSNVLVQKLNALEINFLLTLQYNLHVKPSDTAHVNFNIQTDNPKFALQFFHRSELPASTAQPKAKGYASLKRSG